MSRERGPTFACLFSVIVAACGPRNHASSDSGSGSPATSDSGSDSTTGSLCPATTSGDASVGSTANPDCLWIPPETSDGSSASSSSSGGAPAYLDLGVPSFDPQVAAAQICDSVLGCDCTTPPFADRCTCIIAMIAEFAKAEQAAAEHGLMFQEDCIAKLAVTYPLLNCAEPTRALTRAHLCPVVSGSVEWPEPCTEYPGGSDCLPNRECDGTCDSPPPWEGIYCEDAGKLNGCGEGMYCDADNKCAPLPHSGEECGRWWCQPFETCPVYCAAGLECVNEVCEDPNKPNIGDPCSDGCCAEGLHCTTDNVCAAGIQAGQPCVPSFAPTCGQKQCGDGLTCHAKLGICAKLGGPGDACDEFVPCAPEHTCKGCVCVPSEAYFCRPDVHLPWL